MRAGGGGAVRISPALAGASRMMAGGSGRRVEATSGVKRPAPRGAALPARGAEAGPEGPPVAERGPAAPARLPRGRRSRSPAKGRPCIAEVEDLLLGGRRRAARPGRGPRCRCRARLEVRDEHQQLDAARRSGRPQRHPVPLLQRVRVPDALAVHVGAGGAGDVREDHAVRLPGHLGVDRVHVGRLQAQVAVGPGAQHLLRGRRLEDEALAVPRAARHHQGRDDHRAGSEVIDANLFSTRIQVYGPPIRKRGRPARRRCPRGAKGVDGRFKPRSEAEARRKAAQGLPPDEVLRQIRIPFIHRATGARGRARTCS